LTTSALLLPLPPALPAPQHLFRLDTGAQRPPRILMVEDDLTIATMYRLQLQNEGFDVKLAMDGIAGLHHAQVDPPDLMLLDVRLPKLDGIEVMRRLSADPRLAGIPVLILSNYSDSAIVREGLGLGAREYLVKAQTTPAELVAKIRAHLPNV
jgi:DNA-binding response OmpR family regulator